MRENTEMLSLETELKSDCRETDKAFSFIKHMLAVQCKIQELKYFLFHSHSMFRKKNATKTLCC